MSDEVVLVVRGGRGKDGRAEPVDELRLSTGEVVALVGPTGSGKTRLLADLEWLSDGDSPSGRQVELGSVSGREEARQQVVRISQTMSFMLDATAEELLTLHARYRDHPDATAVAREALAVANRISGESFAPSVALAALSGGQARALMVADAVVVGRARVILIDEIENAGIDRALALELLLERRQVAVLATHDPLIALRASRRVVFAGGAMQRVIERSDREVALLAELQAQQERRDEQQARLRQGLELE